MIDDEKKKDFGFLLLQGFLRMCHIQTFANTP